VGIGAPPELSGLLAQVGERWPEADEDQLEELAGAWRRAASNMRDMADGSAAIARRVAHRNEGDSVNAFVAYEAQLRQHVLLGANAADSTAGGLTSYANTTIVLKKEVITILHKAQAVIRKIAGPLIKLAGPLIKFFGPIITRVLSWVKGLLRSLFQRVLRFIKEVLGPLFKRIAQVIGRVVAFLKRVFGGRKKPDGPVRKKWNGNHPPKEAVDKVPSGWGPGSPNRKASKGKPGWRWADPKNPAGMNIRIDKGDPNSPFESQRVDHVRITYKGKVIGPDGREVPSGKPGKTRVAHIPLAEWLNWKTWYSP
jgi:hypothetical protein